jgi:hypothetical protein
MSARYADGTQVSSDRSKAEIERTLRRFGADQFVYGWEYEQAIIGFRMSGRVIRLGLPLPDASNPMIRLTPTGRERTDLAVAEEYEKEVRRRWRSLAAVLKAKLVAVQDGISTIEREFLADVVLSNGHTLGEWALPQLDAAAGDSLPALLPET